MIAVWTTPGSISDVTDEPAVLVTYWANPGPLGLTDCERVFFLEGL